MSFHYFVAERCVSSEQEQEYLASPDIRVMDACEFLTGACRAAEEVYESDLDQKRLAEESFKANPTPENRESLRRVRGNAIRSARKLNGIYRTGILEAA